MYRRILAILLALSLISVCLPPALALAADGTSLAIDVRTNRGGAGFLVHGGEYAVGEEPILYVQATSICFVQWSVIGPAFNQSGELSMESGEEYVWQMGLTQQEDIGSWQVIFQAKSNGQYATDMVSFEVLGSTPAPPVQTTPTTIPETELEEEAATPDIDEENAIELASLIALQMAEGRFKADTAFDTDGDGMVSSNDARTLLNWSVTAIGGSLPSADQLEVTELFGEPSQFIVSYVLSDEVEMDFLVREETWYYPQYSLQINFVAGDLFDAAALAAVGMETSATRLRPWDFDCFMNYEEVSSRIVSAGGGGFLQKVSINDLTHLDFTPEFLEAYGFNAYLADTAFFLMEGDELAYIQVFGSSKPDSWQNMLGFHPGEIMEQYQTASFSISHFNPLNPPPVYARISFKKFGRWVGKNVKKTARAIHRVPGKVAQVFPRQIRPVVITILETKMGRLPAWRIAAKVNNIADLEQGLKNLRDTYNQQAANIDASARKLREEQASLETGAPSSLGMSLSEWKNRYNLVKDVADSLENISSQLRNKADNTSLGDVMRIGMTQLARSTLRNIENAAMKQVGDELKKRIGEGTFEAFIRTGEGNTTVDKLIDIAITGRIAAALKDMGADAQFRSKVEGAVKDELKKSRSQVRDIDSLIEKTIERVRKEGATLLEKAKEEEKKLDEEEKKPQVAEDLGSYNTLSFYVLIDAAKFNDNTTQSWSIRGDLLPGKFSDHTFSASKTFQNNKGCNVTQEVKATFNDDFSMITDLYIGHFTDCPQLDGIKASIAESTVSAGQLEVDEKSASRIWSYTTDPDASSHNTEIAWNYQYGSSNPDYMTGFACKQQCWIEVKIETK